MALLRLRQETATAILCGLIGLTLAVAARPAAADVGFSDGSFSGTSAPSGMKPQSKLWVADGIWGGGRSNTLPQRFEISGRHADTEQWSSTGRVVHGRRNIWADAKWNGTHLFV